MGRGLRAVALMSALAVGTFTISSTASAQSTPPQTDDQYEQAFRQTIGPQTDELVEALRSAAEQAGIEPGNGTVGPVEVGRAGHGEIEQALVILAKLLHDAGYVAGVGFVLAALFKFWAHKTDPKPVPLSLLLIFGFAAAIILSYASLHQPITYGPAALIDDVQPVLREAARQADGERPQLPADAQQTIEKGLRKRGITGDALDAFTQLELLTAGVLLADARA